MGLVDRFGNPIPSQPGYEVIINSNGAVVPQRKVLQLGTGLTATDDVASGATVIAAGGGSGGSVHTVSADVQTVDLTVDSANDGGWEIWGHINQVSLGGDCDVCLEPAQNTGSHARGGSYRVDQGTSTVSWDDTGSTPDYAKLFISRGGGNANRERTFFRGRLTYKDGVGGFWECRTIMLTAAGAVSGGRAYNTQQVWLGTDSAWTSLRLAATLAAGIKYNSGTNPSWFRWKAIGLTA